MVGNQSTEYIGQYKDGNFHGVGCYIVDEETYVGEFETNKKQGFGIQKITHKDTWIGRFKDDKPYKAGAYHRRGHTMKIKFYEEGTEVK